MELQATSTDKGKRLDHFLQEMMPRYSRSRLQDWVKSGLVLVDGASAKASLVLKGGEAIGVWGVAAAWLNFMFPAQKAVDVAGAILA